ncbi:MAG: SpoIID/LytB domain-containing protein [Candidatus Firestonebacteria bacterium]
MNLKMGCVPVFIIVLFFSCAPKEVIRKEIKPEEKFKTLFDEGNKYYYEGDFKSAEEKYIESLSIYTSDEVYANLATLYKDTGRLNEAIVAYESSLKIKEDLFRLNNLAFCYYYVGRSSKAIILFNEVLKKKNFVESNIILLYTHFGLGCSLLKEERFIEAISEFNETLNIKPRFAQAYFKLGQVYEKLGELDKSVNNYQKAVKADSSLYNAYLLLADLYERKKLLQESYEYYKKVSLIEPKNKELQKKLKDTASKIAEYVKKEEEKKEGVRKVTKSPLVSCVLKPEGIPVVKVGLVSNVNILRLKCAGKFYILKNNEIIKEIPRDEEIKFEKSKKDFTIKDKNDKIILELVLSKGLNIILKGDNREATFTIYDVTLNKGYFWVKNLDRSFRGSLEILLEDGLTVINNINLEEYLYSVVPSEISALAEIESLKAQAVVARSYVLNKMLKKRHENFQVCSDVHCLAYNGVFSEHKNTTFAVDATRGEVLSCNDKVINTFFFSCCGGITCNVEDAWGGNVNTNLKSIADYIPESENLEYNWPLTPEKLEKWIKLEPVAFCSNDSNFRWFKIIEDINNVQISKRDSNGYVKEVIVDGKKIVGDKIRGILPGLRSNFFKIEKNFIYGCGWGHGVGLCQSGSVGLAKKGYSYKEILQHYFRDTILITNY